MKSETEAFQMCLNEFWEATSHFTIKDSKALADALFKITQQMAVQTDTQIVCVC